MKGKYILFLICSLFLCEVSAQTLEQARTLFTKGEYEQAKPVFKKYTKSQPSNGNYNYWYGVCCLKTGEAEEAVKPLEIAVKKRITGGQLYLGQAYNETYRFEDAVNCFEEYIADLSKRKKPTEEAEKLLEKSKSDLRMLKGVEEVCIIDSFVVDKATNCLLSMNSSRQKEIIRELFMKQKSEIKFIIAKRARKVILISFQRTSC